MIVNSSSAFKHLCIVVCINVKNTECFGAQEVDIYFSILGPKKFSI